MQKYFLRKLWIALIKDVTLSRDLEEALKLLNIYKKKSERILKLDLFLKKVMLIKSINSGPETKKNVARRKGLNAFQEHVSSCKVYSYA